jgi:hypothetical protein
MADATIDERSIEEFLGRKKNDESRKVINSTVSEINRFKARPNPKVIYRRPRERNGRTHIYSKREINMTRWQNQLAEQVKAKAPISKLCLTVLTSGNAVTSSEFAEAIKEAGKKDIKPSNTPAILADIRDSEAGKVIHTKKERGKWVYQLRPEAQEMSVEDLYRLYTKSADYSLRDAAQSYPDLKPLLDGDKRSVETAAGTEDERTSEAEHSKSESPIPSRIQIDVNFSPIEVIFKIRK